MASHGFAGLDGSVGAGGVWGGGAHPAWTYADRGFVGPCGPGGSGGAEPSQLGVTVDRDEANAVIFRA